MARPDPRARGDVPAAPCAGTAGFRLERGANADPAGGVRFGVWAPHARRVTVRVACAGGRREQALEPAGGGVFEGHVAEASPGCDYVYALDGSRERPDPVSRHQPAGVRGPSRVVDPAAFAWSDAGWTGVERADLVLYELHVGTFTPRGSFDGVAGRLDDLCELGVTALELMPVAAFPGARNWGYDGVFPYAPHEAYGGPDGLRRLVDAAHARGLAVLLDVVYNHVGPDGSVLADFGPYFTDRYRTPWGQALNFDGPESDEVRRYFCDNALHWIAEYHLDGLRLDAVHAIYDASPLPFLGEVRQAVHALGARLGRVVHVIAESDANDPRLVREPARGGLGLDAVWSDDFHHAAHAALTGERDRYYVDFGSVPALAKAFADRFVYDGAHSRFRRRRHGAPARDVARDRFVVFVQNHDQVGNRASGERLAALLTPPRLRLAAALCLLSPYVPLLFMGEEYGETAPFLYFVSHEDAALVEAVRRGRREEFRLAPDAELPDPADEATLRRSQLRHELARAPGHAELRALYRELLHVRRTEPALRPGAARIDVACDAAAGWIRVDYRPPRGRAAFAAFQLGAESCQAPAPDGSWRLRLASDDRAFGGPGTRAFAKVGPEGARLALPAESALLYLDEAA